MALFRVSSKCPIKIEIKIIRYCDFIGLEGDSLCLLGDSCYNTIICKMWHFKILAIWCPDGSGNYEDYGLMGDMIFCSMLDVWWNYQWGQQKWGSLK